MPKQSRSRSRLEPRILILFLLLGIPPLLVGHLLLVNRAENRFKDVIGTYFQQKADRLQTELIGHVETVSVQLANLTSVPSIQEVVRQSNAREPFRASRRTGQPLIEPGPDSSQGYSKTRLRLFYVTTIGLLLRSGRSW